MRIRHLKEEGVAKTEIARLVGVSRQTVYNHLADKEREQTQAPRASKLDPYRDHIRHRLECFDLPATVLLDEIKTQGYEGSVTILREYVAEIKEKKVTELVERFETVPGQQAQADWAECGTFQHHGRQRKLYLFVLLLGYSRMLFARFTTSTRRPEFLRLLREGFSELGICRELLIDNMKQAVDRGAGTGARFNPEFLDFASHHGFMPVASPPYWPRAKGKVERGISYIKKSFLEGRSFADLGDLNRQLDAWLFNANRRIHKTTKERPTDRYRREVDHLIPLSAVPVYDTRPQEVRKVHTDSHLSFGGVRYSVDPEAVGHTVTVRAQGEKVGAPFTVHLGAQVVAEHVVAPPGRGRVTLPSHEKKIRTLSRRGKAKKNRTVRFCQYEEPEVATRSLSSYERLLDEVPV